MNCNPTTMPSPQANPNAPEEFEIEVFFDGECPLCRREIKWLQNRDHDGRIRFTDLGASDFRPESLRRTTTELMARIHGRLPDGQVIEGVEVFRRMYAAVGFGFLVRISRWMGIRHLLDWSYSLFARNRLWLTGRCRADSGCRTEG